MPLRVAAILHPYEPDSLLEPFRAPNVNLFRGTEIERGDLPSAVIVFGGDGSVHRLLPALAETACPLLVVPTGSGNDFAHSIGIRTLEDALHAWRAFLADPLRSAYTVDLGLLESPVTPPFDDSANPDRVPDAPPTWTFADADGRIPAPKQKINAAIMQSELRHLSASEAQLAKTYFCCIAGVGLDSEATARANPMSRWFRRHGGYSWAALRALKSHRSRHILATLDDGTVFSGAALLCAFGNAPSYGGGLRMLPRADQ